MRLLNVHSLEFQEHYTPIPPYAIASHRWKRGTEASYEDVCAKSGTGEGYRKVVGFAEYVKTHVSHVDWVWIDTCCIKQDSTVEVSEAINSMFRWYRNAEVCLAYLADVPRRDGVGFDRSEWFKRGWTLQELLAPQTVLFLTSNWEIIGHKGGRGLGKSGVRLDTGPSLEKDVAERTGIARDILRDFERSERLTVDQKLDWIAGRETLREEDLSYSLLGIFDLSMSVRYGEGGEKARKRLLHKIRKEAEATQQQVPFSGEQSSPGEGSKQQSSTTVHQPTPIKQQAVRTVSSTRETSPTFFDRLFHRPKKMRGLSESSSAAPSYPTERSTQRQADTPSPRPLTDVVYLTYYRVRLTDEDIKSIRSGRLTESAVAFWEEYLEQEKLPDFTNSLRLLRPSTADQFTQSTDAEFHRYILPDFKANTHVFFPIRGKLQAALSRGYHWSLLLVSVMDGLAFHYDSMSPSNVDEARCATDRISRLIKKPIHFTDIDNMPQQTNSVDGGAYMCALMQHLIFQKLLKTRVGDPVLMSIAGKEVDTPATRKHMLKLIEEIKGRQVARNAAK